VAVTTEAGQEDVSGEQLAPRRRSWKVGARRVIMRYTFLFAFGSLLGGLMPWLGGGWFLFELGSHFQHVYVWMAIAAAAAIAVARMWKLLPVALAGLALAAWHVAPCYIPPGGANASGAKLRVMSVNVLTVNGNHEGLARILANERPDVVALQELDETWAVALRELEGDYPYQIVEPQSDNFGIGIMSRYPLGSVELIDLVGVIAIRAKVSVNGQLITVLNAHTLPPSSPANAALRNQQLERIPELVNGATGPVILLGDLNTTMWSPYFRELLGRTGLKDARRGFGVVATWPDDLAPLTIPIDHCLYSLPLAVEDFRAGARFGSDHLPLTIDFVVPQPSGELTNAAAT
jgi:endonuclease/exonuclease/phosphatase (EEP) superfamily protein YafD